MDLNKKIKELKPQQLNCNVFDVYSYNGLTMQDLLCQFFTTINECVKSTNEVIDLTDWLVNVGLEEEVVKKLMVLIEDGTVEKLINVNLFNTLNSKINNLNTEINTLNKGKVSKNGVGEVTWANIAQDARENISGGTTAIVGTDSVSTVNVVDNSITSAKRTTIGEWGFIQGKHGNSKLDLDNRKLILPPGTSDRFVTYRNVNYAIPTDVIEVDLDFEGSSPNSCGGFIYFDTVNKTFITGDESKLNENCIFIGFVWWSDKVQDEEGNYYQPEPIYHLNITEDKSNTWRQGIIQNNEYFYLDYNNRTLIIPEQFYITYEGVNKLITGINSVDISGGVTDELTGCFLWFDVATNTFKTGNTISSARKEYLFIGFIWWPEKKIIPNSNNQKFQPEPIYMFNATIKPPIRQTYANGRYAILNSANGVTIDLYNNKIKFNDPTGYNAVYDGFSHYHINSEQVTNGIDIDLKNLDETVNDAVFVYFNTQTTMIEFRTGSSMEDATSLVNCLFLGVIFSNGRVLSFNCSNYKVENYVNVNEHSRWRGKTINILGDSITEGKGTTIKYADLLSKALGVNVRNYGISGSSISSGSGEHTGSNPMVERFANMDDNADGIIVFGGTNDFWYRHTPLGTINDSDKTTFYGSLRVLIEGLINKYPTVPIMFITPLHRTDGDGCSENTPNPHGKKLVDYVNAIKEVCELYSIKVCDLWSKSGIQPNIPIHKDLYTSKTTGYPDGDGLHPNEIGHQRIAPIIANDFNDLI